MEIVSGDDGAQAAGGPTAGTRRASRLLRLVSRAALLAALLLMAYALLIWPWMAHWGATDAEMEMTLPGDELVPSAGMQTTQAVTVRAPASAVWPWLVQMGVDRGGMYSYEWVENLIGLRVRNADRIVPEWQDLKVGDFMRFTPPDYAIPHGPGNWVMAMDKPNHLLFCSGQADIALDACLSTWQFVLREQGDGTTRLILRSRSVDGGPVARAFGRLGQAPIFLMQRRMLLGIQQRVEAHAAQP